MNQDWDRAMPAEGDRLEIERLREGMVVELDRRFTLRDEHGPKRNRNDDVEAEVASTISVVRQVATVMAEFQETIRRQEELLYDQRQTIAELQHQKQVVAGELADAERIVRSERERAERAEHQLHGADVRLRRLEEYSATLKSHLSSLMNVVRDNLAESTANTPQAAQP